MKEIIIGRDQRALLQLIKGVSTFFSREFYFKLLYASKVHLVVAKALSGFLLLHVLRLLYQFSFGVLISCAEIIEQHVQIFLREMLHFLIRTMIGGE